MDPVKPPETALRAVWIDRLRVGLTLLVIAHHAAITYGAAGSWFYKATQATSMPLTLLAAINQAYFMGLFFMISGALATASLDRRGTASFLADRVLRLGLPVLAFGFILGPLTVALAVAPFGDILIDTVRRILRGSFVLGPLWFPAALLAFSVVMALLPARRGQLRPVPPLAQWLSLALMTGFGSLMIRQAVPAGASIAGFQLGYFASYVVLFAVGVMAGRNHWLDSLPLRSLRLSIVVGLVSLPLLPMALLSADAPRFETGFSLVAITYAFWEPLVAIGAIAGLIHLSRACGSTAAAFWSWMAENSYGAFIVHAPVLVAVCRVLDALEASHAAALPISICTTALVAFGTTAVLRRSKLVRQAI